MSNRCTFCNEENAIMLTADGWVHVSCAVIYSEKYKKRAKHLFPCPYKQVSA